MKNLSLAPPVRSLIAATRLVGIVAVAAWAAATCVAEPPAFDPAVVDQIVGEALEKGPVAAVSVAIVRDGRLLLARGYGESDIENHLAADAETVYRLGSITKQFTAMAILQLAEEGKLALDDKLTRFLPDYPTAGHEITIHHLLTHTSGIKSYTDMPQFWGKMREPLDHDAMLELFSTQPFEFDPGTKWKYCNSGYYLLGMIIEEASGKTYGEYLEEKIFRPLAMSSTRVDDYTELIPRRARGYRVSKGKLVNDAYINMRMPGAAGALVSTALDLVKWHVALEEGLLISPESYEKLYKPVTLADGSTHPYAYGWMTGELAGHKSVAHGGGIQGFSTVISRYPDDRLAVIALANTAGANVSRIESRIAKALLGIEEPKIEDRPLEPELAEKLPGEYQLGEGKVTVKVTDGKVVVEPANGPADELRYQGELRFVSGREPEATITFTKKDDRIDGFVFEFKGQRREAKRAE